MVRWLVWAGMILLVACGNDELPLVDTNSEGPIFERVSGSQSGIKFSNTLTENLETKANLFDFDYFYNGAGVGVGDINNDGLPDLFFCGNQVPNRLYLNKGNLQFEDISDKAGINRGKQWSNGVTFADVNRDGLLDIYVSQGGPLPAASRKNLLFINQGDLTFEEQASLYALDDPGLSTQSVFFDYDGDGDLDCLVSNENELYGVDPVNFYRILGQNPSLMKGSLPNLYRNEGRIFTKVTQEAGLFNPTFGLGVIVSDINEDGKLDFYLANDYYVPDMMYINKGDGTFYDEIKSRTRQLTFYGMGVDIADINNDGLKDIFVLDMASADHFRAKTLMASMSTESFRLLTETLEMPHQYMFNSLQVNQGNGNFHNAAHLTKMAQTDWSWAGLIADMDNDGQQDVFVSNGYRRYALDNDLKIRVQQAKQEYGGEVPLEVKKELYESMPSEKLPNLLYRNEGNLQFQEVASSWGLPDPSFSNGAAYGDLDGDGDLDLVVNNLDEEAFLYKNLSSDEKRGHFLRIKAGKNTSESFARVEIRNQGKVQVREIKRVRGYFSSVEPVAHFGLGAATSVDTLIVRWPDGSEHREYNVQADQELVLEKKGAIASVSLSSSSALFKQVPTGPMRLFYRHKENEFDDFIKEILLPYRQSTLGPCLASADINQDGKEDIYMGGASGQPAALFVQTEDGFQKLDISAFKADAAHEDLGALFLDYDGDGDEDLLVSSGGNAFEAGHPVYQDRLYQNMGNGQFEKVRNPLPGQEGISSKATASIDYDGDGDLDLIVGGRIVPQHYPQSANSQVWENDGGVFKRVTQDVAPAFEAFGMVNDILVTDFNTDGKPDFIALGEWTSPGFFENKGGRFEEVGAQKGLEQEKGWWFSVTETDANGDGKPDYILGNLGLNSKFSASAEKPFKVFAGDFDDNGAFDVVLSKKYKGDFVPVRGRECSSEQMPFVKEKFPTYEEFAQAKIDDIYDLDAKAKVSLEATGFGSLLLLNDGNGGFEKRMLPVEAQLFPLLDVEVIDLNDDGIEDLILAGTIFDTEVETPRWDAGSGLVLLANGDGEYTPASARTSGLFIPGDVKALQLLQHEGMRTTFLVAGCNNAGPAVFQLKK